MQEHSGVVQGWAYAGSAGAPGATRLATSLVEMEEHSGVARLLAGQSAPGGGIGFRGGEISFANSSNVILRHVRIRPGSAAAERARRRDSRGAG